MNDDALQQMDKGKLISMIHELREEVSSITADFQKVTNLRLYQLERAQNMNFQYGRRDTVEITGIPDSVLDNALEDEVIEIFKDAKIQVNRQPLKKQDIQAVHRKANKKTTIVKVVNRKFAREALYCSKNLKDNKRYDGIKLYINDSFCPEFGFLNYAVRKAKKDGAIFKWKVRNGVTSVQIKEGDAWSEIGHELDLTNLKIPVPTRKGKN